MKVAIYHPFTDLADNYSLTYIALEQLYMMVEHGIETYLFTSVGFNDPRVPKEAIVMDVLHGKTVEEETETLREYMKDITTVLTHDVVALSSYKIYSNAIRLYARENAEIQWLHWTHSAPNPSESKAPVPNSLYICVNKTDIPLLAKQHRVSQLRCRTVYNPRSPDLVFRWEPFTKALVDKHELLECDFLVVYPLDTGRFEAKGGYKIIKLVEKLREKGRNAKVVFVNAAADTPQRKKIPQDLANEYTIFTSLEDKRYETVVPQKIVQDLKKISNLFPLLSMSEGCSLTMLEAGLNKELVILNKNFPPLTEFGGVGDTLYMESDSTRGTVKYNPSEDAYYEDWANILVDHYNQSPIMRFNRKVLREFNREYIYETQLRHLLR